MEDDSPKWHAGIEGSEYADLTAVGYRAGDKWNSAWLVVFTAEYGSGYQY